MTRILIKQSGPLSSWLKRELVKRPDLVGGYVARGKSLYHPVLETKSLRPLAGTWGLNEPGADWRHLLRFARMAKNVPAAEKQFPAFADSWKTRLKLLRQRQEEMNKKTLLNRIKAEEQAVRRTSVIRSPAAIPFR